MSTFENVTGQRTIHNISNAKLQMEGNINSIEEGTSNLSEMVDQCCCPEQEDQSITNSLIRMVDMYMQRKSLNFIKFQIAVYIHYPF